MPRRRWSAIHVSTPRSKNYCWRATNSHEPCSAPATTAMTHVDGTSRLRSHEDEAYLRAPSRSGEAAACHTSRGYVRDGADRRRGLRAQMGPTNQLDAIANGRTKRLGKCAHRVVRVVISEGLPRRTVCLL